MAHCKDCGDILEQDNWPKWRQKNRQYLCYSCGMARYADWYEKHRERLIKRQRDYRQKIRLEVIKAYGEQCECCGLQDQQFLTVDHVKGGGGEHKKSIGGNRNFYNWLKKNGFPKEGFRLLCFNCNQGRFIYGVCPHESFRLSNGSVKE